MRDLGVRLADKAFDWSFVRSFVLPEWWEDELADTEANRALAEGYISKQLGFNMKELRDRHQSPSAPKMPDVRFKRYKNQVDDRVRAAALVDLQGASMVTRAVDERLPTYSGPIATKEIRATILRGSTYVDPASLLGFRWKTGIAILQLAHTPAKSKRFDGMAASVRAQQSLLSKTTTPARGRWPGKSYALRPPSASWWHPSTTHTSFASSPR